MPFCFIAIPGLSTPFGTAICLIGACMVVGREPWLPASFCAGVFRRLGLTNY
jgi:hypothetical protein